MTFLACAALLASACMFTACKKDKTDEELQQATQEGSYNGEVVKTEFSIALPAQAVGGPNRMPSTTVQIGGRSEFQGMTDITLIPFEVLSPSVIETTTKRLGANIGLTDIENAAALGTNSNAKVYPSVAIPTGTSAFLFYARSKKTGTDHEIGSLTANGLTANTPAGITFTLKQIMANSATPFATGSDGLALLAYLNSIANAKDENDVLWKEYTNTESVAMTALFAEFKKWHSLSTTAVQNGLADLYTSMNIMSTTLAANIKAAIANSTYATVSGTGAEDDPFVVTLKNTPDGMTNFPEHYGLPEGSVRIKYNDYSKEFQACTAAEYETANNAKLDAYVYPAQLWYFANSYIKTSNASRQAMYNSTTYTWDDILAAHEGALYVNPGTRAVAIEDQIQYGVARLDVIVKLAYGTLEDNKQPVPNNITCAAYPLTAVLVGGQRTVDYKFLPTGTDEFTIYDNVMTGTTIEATTANTAANSTLVLESPVGADKHINIAVELVNNSGHDFVGYEGQIIKAGAKFYLPAELKATGTGKTTDRTLNQVFKQDYTTTATLTVANLKNARNTIPDLRTPQLELGLSVNLEWTEGNVYDIDI